MCPGGKPGCGSLAFPAVLLGLRPLPAWPSRSSRIRRLVGGKPPRIDHRALWSPLQRAHSSAGAPRNLRRPVCKQTEWPQPWAPPLLGFVYLAPLHRNNHPRIHSPRDPGKSRRRNALICRERPRVRADGATRRHQVPPAWFLTTSTAFSARRLRVCCASLPAMGFTAFPVPRARSPKGVRVGVGRSPQWVHTLRRVPLVNSRAASLRPLPSCRCHSVGDTAPPATPVAERLSQCHSAGTVDFTALLR